MAQADEFEMETFPILCETCLGPNPYIRMTQEAHAKACKICDRPMLVFRWKPGSIYRYKKTEICKTCAKLKNVCQTCILDLQYGLPVQVRDAALEESEKLAAPVSNPTRDWQFAQLDKEMKEKGAVALSKVKRPNAMLHRLQRSGPYYDRNRPHVCSFFLRGICNRGADCPYRHEKVEIDGPLAEQNIKDRFYGQNDPVAEKLMKRYDKIKQQDNKLTELGPPTKPEDPTVRTLYVGGIDESYTREDIKEQFDPFGQIDDISMVGNRFCCFVTFRDRDDAERAVNALYDHLYIKGKRMKVLWGKGKIVKKNNQQFSGRIGPPGMARKAGPPGMMKKGMPGPIRAQVPIRNPLGNQQYGSMSAGYGANTFG